MIRSIYTTNRLVLVLLYSRFHKTLCIIIQCNEPYLLQSLKGENYKGLPVIFLFQQTI